MKLKGRRIITSILALCFAMTLLFGWKGEIRQVDAEEYEPVYVVNVNGVYEDLYAYSVQVFTKDDFDANGNIQVRAIKEMQPDFEDYDDYEEFEKIYDNHAIYLLSDEADQNNLVKNHAFGIGTDRVNVKWDFGQWINLNKSSFVYDPETKDYYIDLFLVCDYKEQWVDGQYFDASGSKSYGYKGSWQGSGTSYWYQDEAGWYPTSSWVKIDFSWYYFKEDGYAACNEWLNVNGAWYHFRKDCTYDWDCWIEGYYISKDGVQSYEPTGSWFSDNKGWWFADTAGWYPTDEEVEIDGLFYYFKADGYMAQSELIQTKWDKENDTWSYYDENGQFVWEKSGYYDEEKKWHTYDE